MSKNLDSEQVNRLWQLGMHSQNRFDNRLNFFLIFESVLIGVVGTLYSKLTLAKPILITIVCLGFILTILWGYTQVREKYLFDQVNSRLREAVPEYQEILQQRKKWPIGSLALLTYGIPGLLAIVWIVLLIFAVAV